MKFFNKKDFGKDKNLNLESKATSNHLGLI